MTLKFSASVEKYPKLVNKFTTRSNSLINLKCFISPISNRRFLLKSLYSLSRRFFACSIRNGERSMPVTLNPFFANNILCLPFPHARSRHAEPFGREIFLNSSVTIFFASVSSLCLYRSKYCRVLNQSLYQLFFIKE